MNLVFLSSVEFESLQPVLQTLIEESARRSRTILATPRAEAAMLPDGVEARSVFIDRPLELQSATDWLAAAGKPLVVALSVSAEPATISYRFPIAWVEPLENPLPIFRATSLAHRSALVSGHMSIKDQYNIPSERFIEIGALTPDRLITAGADLSPYQPPARYHAALSAESFTRHEAGSSLLEDISGISMYKKSRITRRFDLATHGRLSDTNRLMEVSEGIDPEVEEFAPDLLRQFVVLQNYATLEQVMNSDLSRHFDELTSTEQRMVIVQALARSRSEENPDSSALRVLREQIDRSGMYRLLTPRDVTRFNQDSLTPTAFLKDIKLHGQPLAATTAEVEVLKRYAMPDTVPSETATDDEVDLKALVARTEDLIAEIDARSPYPAVWKAACDYWWKISGSMTSEPPDPVPAPPVPDVMTGSGRSLLDDINETNRSAGEALKHDQFMESARLYDIVRALCLLHEPKIPTTEKAARLNAGWALWKGGAARQEWAPYVASVLHETGTPDQLRVRSTLQAVLVELASPERAKREHLRSIQLRMSQGDGLEPKQKRDLLTSLVSEIDGYSIHASLWESGLSYWRQMSGEEWTGSPVDPPPALVSRPEGTVDLTSIQQLDFHARRAMGRGRWKKAINLFEKVRGACQLHDPPVVSTERAARLNIGWAMWELGRGRAEWQPYLTSVMDEVGPGAEFAAARSEAIRVLTSDQVLA